MSSFRLLRLVFAFLYRQNRIGNSAAQTNIYRLLAKSRKIARLARECWQQLQTHPSVCLFRRTQNIFFRIYGRYQASALRALGLLLADRTPTVGGGKTF